MSESGDALHVVESSVETVEEEDFYSESDEIVLSPQDPITRELINGWEEKFNKITEGVPALERSTHDVHTHMDTVMRESRARESAQTSTSRQIESIKEALARFMEAYDPARPTPVSTFIQPCAPTMITTDQARQTPARTLTQPRAPMMSTPITPPGAPPKFRLEFSLSPVNQATPAETMRVDRGRDTNERPTHENGNGIGGDTQLTMNTSSALNNAATRNASSIMPIVDGTVSAHFRP